MAARVNHWVEGLLIKPFMNGNAAAAERSDEQVRSAFACLVCLPGLRTCAVVMSLRRCVSNAGDSSSNRHARPLSIGHCQSGSYDWVTTWACELALWYIMFTAASSCLAAPQQRIPCRAASWKWCICAQRTAAHAAVSAAQVAGVTQRALARSRAAADPTDIEATLAAASLSSSEVLMGGRFDGLTAISSSSAEEAAAARGLWGDDPRPRPNEAQRLFGASGLNGGAVGARSGAGRILDVEYRLTVEVKLHALLLTC